MYSEINNSKEAIKRRMIKHAMNYWDIKTGNEYDLDPIVKLILEALSAELYNLGNDFADTQVRVLEKIASLLTPDFLTCPSPAHGLLQALPIEPTELLNDKTDFFTQLRISSKKDEVFDTSINVYFTPVDNIEVFDAQIAYAITGNKLMKYDGGLSRQLLPNQSRGALTEENTLWLGLKLNKDIEDINNLSFCFDWKNIEPQHAFRLYQLLPLAQWYVDDLVVKTTGGAPYVKSLKSDDPAENIFLNYNLLSLIKKDVKSFYDAKFVAINDDGLGRISGLKKNYPESFKNYFKESDLQKWNEKLLWVKIVFPASLKQEHLDELNIYLNAFPVINRRLIDKKYRLTRSSNIIPLETSSMDQFLSIQSLSDDTREYKSIPYRKKDDAEIGTYTLRNGGVERFDVRNAKELINYLLESLRSESLAFSAFGLDNITNPLKEISQRIALIELKTQGVANDAVEIPTYIIVKPYEGKDLMFIEHWVTLAEEANNLRAGTKLQQLTGSKVRPGSVFLLTPTIGGKSRLKPEERLNAFKYGLMTRDRIITKEDVINFCNYELGNRVTKITVAKGFEMSSHPQQGFNRTIDVIISPQKTESQNKEEWQILCEQLRLKLQTRSGMSNNYRVLLQNGGN
ncbi:MAG TPA: hypothetical protein VFE53_18915 [Mucilaginibacter sp.]|jgi:hypothetical protein|nr:hypothetical protein [Mucilaginibacter sp.]